MLDTTELVHSLTSPPALSHDTPIVSGSLPDIENMSVGELATMAPPQFFQDQEDLSDFDDEEEDLDYLTPPWEDDTVD